MARIVLNPPASDHMGPPSGPGALAPEHGDSWKTVLTNLNSMMTEIYVELGLLAIPTGYTVAWDTNPVNNAGKAAAGFTVSGLVSGQTVNYTVTTTGGSGKATGSGVAAGATLAFTGVDLTSVEDGTITVSVKVTTIEGIVGLAATATALKDVVAPAGYTTVFVTDPITALNQAAVAIDILTGVVGATYALTVTTDGGAGTFTRNGTIAAATTHLTGMDMTAVQDGTLTVSVVLTDPSGNAGSAATDTVTKSIT